MNGCCQHSIDTMYKAHILMIFTMSTANTRINSDDREECCQGYCNSTEFYKYKLTYKLPCLDWCKDTMNHFPKLLSISICNLCTQQ